MGSVYGERLMGARSLGWSVGGTSRKPTGILGATTVSG